MKTNSMRLQLYVLVPLIFAGLTALAALLTFHLMRSGAVAAGHTWPVLATAGGLVATAFLFGLLILWLVFRPVEDFLREMKPLVPEGAPPPSAGRRPLEFTPIAPIASTLSRVAAFCSSDCSRCIDVSICFLASPVAAIFATHASFFAARASSAACACAAAASICDQTFSCTAFSAVAA